MYAAVNQNGLALRHVKSPSEENMRIAVKTNPLAVKYIENPSREIQLIILRRNAIGIALKYIQEPHEDFTIELIEVLKSIGKIHQYHD